KTVSNQIKTVSNGGGSSPRSAAISAVINYRPSEPPMNFIETPTQKLFNANVFTPHVMRQRLPKHVYKSVMKTVGTGSKLDPAVADVVATAMKEWALEKGA